MTTLLKILPLLLSAISYFRDLYQRRAGKAEGRKEVEVELVKAEANVSQTAAEVFVERRDTGSLDGRLRDGSF